MAAENGDGNNENDKADVQRNEHGEVVTSSMANSPATDPKPTEPPIKQDPAPTNENDNTQDPAPQGDPAPADNGNEGGNDDDGMVLDLDDAAEGSEAFSLVKEVFDDKKVSEDTMNKIFSKAAESGKPEDIDRDLLEASVGKAHAAVLIKALTDETNAEVAKYAATEKAVHEAAGGQAQWAAVQSWARQSLDQADLAEIDNALREGGYAAKAVATALVNDFRAASRAPNEQGQRLEGNPKLSNTGTGLSRAEYTKQYAELSRKGGTKQQFDQLNAQRSLGVQQGL